MAAKPDRIIHSEPLVRTYRDWSPSLLRSADVMADAGTIMLAADLVERMLADDRIKAVVDARTDALMGLDLSFEEGLGRRKRMAVRALETEADWWAMCPESTLKQLLANGLMLGVGFAEIVWPEYDSGDRAVPKLVVRHPRNFRYDSHGLKWVFRDAVLGDVDVIPGDGNWIVFTPYGCHRPWAFGAWRALSRWSLLKDYAIEDWGFYSNRHGQGILVATGVPEDQRQQAVEDLRSLGSNAAFALGEGFDLKILEATAKTYETFKDQIAAADNAAAVTLLGQNLSTEVSGGSLAAATVHGGVKLEKTKFDSLELSTCLHDQLLVWYAEFNFGDRRHAPWPVWDATPVDDMKSRAAMLQQVAQALATLVQAGAPVDAVALLESFDIPVAAPAPAPAPAAPQQPAAPPAAA